jgi:hypothetical protein
MPACPNGWAVTNLTQNSGVASALASESSAIAYAAGHLYVIYVTNGGVVVSESVDGGLTFSAPAALGGLGRATNAKIVANASGVYATWTQPVASTGTAIFFAASYDFGGSWSAPQQLSGAIAAVGDEAIDAPAENGNVYVSYQNHVDVFVSVSHNSGRTFAPPINLTQNSTNYSQEIGIAHSGGSVVYVIYEVDNRADGAVGEGILRVSMDGGTTWGPTVNVTRSATRAREPLLSTPSAGYTPNEYVIWHEDFVGTNDIFVSRSSDFGATWSPPVDVSNSPTSSRLAAIASEGPNVYAIWREDVAGSYQVWIQVSHDGGQTWAGAVRSGPTGITALPPGESYNPYIVAPAGTPYVFGAWNANSQGSSGTLDTFVRSSADFGTTWSEPTDISRGGPASQNPMIFAGSLPSGHVVPFVAWEGVSGSTQDVLFGTCASGASLRHGRGPVRRPLAPPRFLPPVRFKGLN